jgi:hypothetical protein
MPMHLTAEEQAEVDEDPFADYNVNDAYVVDYDGDSNDPLSAEEDQLADSPGPVHESPIPQPLAAPQARFESARVDPTPPLPSPYCGGANRRWLPAQRSNAADKSPGHAAAHQPHPYPSRS